MEFLMEVEARGTSNMWSSRPIGLLIPVADSELVADVHKGW